LKSIKDELSTVNQQLEKQRDETEEVKKGKEKDIQHLTDELKKNQEDLTSVKEEYLSFQRITEKRNKIQGDIQVQLKKKLQEAQESLK